MVRPRRRRLAIALPAILLGLLMSASGASAADSSFGPHTGNLGVHQLVDNSQYAGATCAYAPSGHLTSLSIRQPIVYAFDRNEQTNTEWVGWRYHVEYIDIATSGEPYMNWSDFAVGPWTKVKATDAHNAAWSAEHYTMAAGSSSHDLYRVSLELGWFAPDRNHRDGRAVHVVTNYRRTTSFGNDRVQLACNESYTTLAAGESGTQTGQVGVHMLIDTNEYPGVTCWFRPFNPRDDLKRIEVRPPVVYARNHGSGIDAQIVGWRFRIQARDYDSEPGPWFDVYESTIVKAPATDGHNAQWSARSFKIADGTAHYDWRAVVVALWFSRSDGSTVGKATMHPQHQLTAWADQRYTYDAGDCGTTLG
jgi:hypothetical protein